MVPDPQARRSDRISIRMPVQICGNDAQGRTFTVTGTTQTVSRHGASMVVPHVLEIDQRVTVRSPSNVTACVQVIGQIGICEEGGVYCLTFVEPPPFDQFWGIRFPAIEAGQEYSAKVLLQCDRCGKKDIWALSPLELEVYEANSSLQRSCESCGRPTSWVSVEFEAPQPRLHRLEDRAPLEPPPPVPIRASDAEKGAERRKFRRTTVKSLGCIPPPDGIGPDDVVSVLDMSKGGVRFRSTRAYFVGQWVNIAVPYTRGAANIFTQGRIMWAGRLDGDNTRQFGLRYLPTKSPHTA